MEKGLICQGLHQISQGRQFPETMKVLMNVQLSKCGLHCDRLDSQMKRPDALQCYILSEQRNRHKPQGLGVLHNHPDARASRPDAL
jgi:hypothetical protein